MIEIFIYNHRNLRCIFYLYKYDFYCRPEDIQPTFIVLTLNKECVGRALARQKVKGYIPYGEIFWINYEQFVISVKSSKWAVSQKQRVIIMCRRHHFLDALQI